MGEFFFYCESVYPECIHTLDEWEHDGALSLVADISQGIETMPDALADLRVGNNVGVRMLCFANPDQLRLGAQIGAREVMPRKYKGA